MSRVADHTALADLLTGGQYLLAVTAHYHAHRRMIAVPLPSIAAAIATTPGKNAAAAEVMRWYLGHTSTVKVVPLELAEAITIGQQRPGPRAGTDPGAWLLTAAVAAVARSLQIPVLTQDPGRYTGHDIKVTALP